MWIKCQQCGGFGKFRNKLFTPSGRYKWCVTICPYCKGKGFYEIKENKERREVEHGKTN